ncbi:ATP-dependent RNA helicase Ddx1 [Papilio machaon]|uniref:ATP-dependent RNA helicase n=1 Tax=Papilio machaon TaxID=76193 RepID=A0A0N1PJI1_PAPMA|nr:ATP-dependent RNA helicase Ddx1 [Papilio machaon]
MTAFEEFGVLPELGKAIEEMEWTLPTDVQAEAIPLILGGGDVLMAAETGSGKTGAFCLPILQIVWETLKDIQEGKTSKVILKTATEWTLSFFDRTEALAVTPDGLRCQSRDHKDWHGCRATKGVHTKGAYYYEAIVTDEGLCRVGWSTQGARLDLGTDRLGFGYGGTGKKSNAKQFDDYGGAYGKNDVIVSIAITLILSFSLTTQARLDLGTDRLGFGYGGTGKKSNAKQFDDYGGAYGKNDVIGCLLNLNSGEIRYTKNGEDLGIAFKLDQSRKSDCYFPAVVLKNAEMSFNFGATPFKHTPPKDYVALCNAPKECVKLNVVSSVQSTDSKPVNNAPQAIIIEPSRELAEQTCNQITKFKKYLENPKVRELLVVGGINVKDQINQLNAGIDIVVGTPGRLEDLIQGGETDAFSNMGGFERRGLCTGDSTPCCCQCRPAEGPLLGDITQVVFMLKIISVINVTLPDEKSNYVHRIGRVGRAERMGLAISLVATVPEKVWYHGEWCSSRGRNCWNTNLIDDRPKGCCMWYNEPQYLADIEDHLNITIQQIEPDMKVPCNEFDGKVVYGEKRKQTGTGYQDHVSQMAPVVRSLQELESQAQLYYLKSHHNAVITA